MRILKEALRGLPDRSETNQGAFQLVANRFEELKAFLDTRNLVSSRERGLLLG
jgi:hypothetical protein